MPDQQEVDSSALDLELISGLADVYQTAHNGGNGQPQKREEASVFGLKLLHISLDSWQI